MEKYGLLFFFCFKQKTANEVAECDWSSDVCSSDLSWEAGSEECCGPARSPACYQRGPHLHRESRTNASEEHISMVQFNVL